MKSEYLINIWQIVIWNSHNMINSLRSYEVLDWNRDGKKNEDLEDQFEEFANALMNVRS